MLLNHKNFRKRARLLCVLSLLTLVLVTYSCKKQLTPVEDQIAKSSQEVDVNQLKQIYLQEIGQNGKSSFAVNDVSVNPTAFIKGTTVKWDKYSLIRRKESKVIQFDVKNDTSMMVLGEIKLGDQILFRNRTTAVFLEFDNGKRINFFMKIIEDVRKTHGKSVINEVTYDSIPKAFNGVILYLALNKKFVAGYHFTNGVATKTVSLAANSNTVNQSTKVNTVTTCESYPIYNTYCEWGGTVANPYESFHGCTYTLAGWVTDCYTSPSGGGLPGDPGTGGGNPGNPGDGCPVGNSVQDGKKIQVVDDPCVGQNEDQLNYLLQYDSGFAYYYSKASRAEKVLIALYPWEGLIIYLNSIDALSMANNVFPGNQTDSIADAFRHAFWNALNTQSVGQSLAKQFADAHESDPSNNNTLAKTMDLYNNEAGRNLMMSMMQLNPSGVPYNNISGQVAALATAGGLVMIENGTIVPTHQ